MSHAQIHKYKYTNKYTNTAYDEVPERPNMWYSVCSLVWPGTEEQITGNFASQIFKKTLKTLIKRSQELPEIFKIVLRPIWWVAGSEQPSPPLHRAAAARLLRRRRRRWRISCFATAFLFSKHTIFLKLFANHISAGHRVRLMALVMHCMCNCASTQLLLIITAAAHISRLYLS